MTSVQQHEGAGRSAMPRRRRFQHAVVGDEPSTAVVEDHAVCTGRSCRSCAAMVLADCVALGCCPFAVVSLLSLALVKAPLVVGRRCVGRFRRRKRMLLHKKRVGDAAGATGDCEKGTKEEADEETGPGEAAPRASSAGLDAEMLWLDQMYQVGHWGFGRVSLSGNLMKAT